MSARTHRQVSLLAGLVLTAGVVAFTVAYFGDTGTSQETPLSDKPAQVFTPRKQVPLDTEARRVAGRFILTAVARENLGESYDLVHPELRQGMTRREWLTGNIPVVYYPAKAIETATFKVDESYPDEAILEVALLPKESAKVKPQIFFIGLKKTGSPLAGELLGSARGAGGPERPRLMLAGAGSASAVADADRAKILKGPLPAARSRRVRSVAGRLSSPRFRRRALKIGLLLAVGVAAALVSIFFWNTATVVETPLHGKADLYVPPIPIKMAPAERRAVIATAARFVETAVRREHAERAYELVGPNLRGTTTRDEWRTGDIPVVPYPVDDARWKFDYSYANEIGLQVAVFPRPGAAVRPAVFNLSLRSVGAGAKRRWLVDSWSPRGGGGSARPSRSDGSPFRVDLAQRSSASTSLGAVWLLVPAALVALALLVPAALFVIERVRSHRAQKAYDASRLA